MTDYVDSQWKGALADVTAAIDGQANVLGPRVLDGVAYVAVRTTGALAMPDSLTATGPELSAAIVGVWMDEAAP